MDIRLRKLHPAQKEIKQSPARFKVVACGRRFGKTTVAVNILATRAAHGESVAYFAPTFRMGAEVWRELKKKLRPIIREVREHDWRLELYGGGLLECWSLANSSAETVRGRKYHYVVIDEAALLASADVWHSAIRPLLTDHAGGALFCSTPRGRNWFWQIYLWGQNTHYSEWASWRFPTTVNPRISAEEVEGAQQDMPERFFKQEYLAEFLDDGGAVFRNIEKVCVGKVNGERQVLSVAHPSPPDLLSHVNGERGSLPYVPYRDGEVDEAFREFFSPGWRRRMGMPLEGEEKRLAISGEVSAKDNLTPQSAGIIPSPDPSPNMGRGEDESLYAREGCVFGVDWGKENDFTAISVMSLDGRQLWLERFNQIGWAVQRGRLASLYEQYKPRVILAEENSVGSVNIEALRADGLPMTGFTTTHKSKAPLIEGLALAMEKEEVVLLDDETLKHELMAYEMTRNAYGWSYSAPPGGHDDTVVATALSLWASRKYGGKMIDFV